MGRIKSRWHAASLAVSAAAFVATGAAEASPYTVAEFTRGQEQGRLDLGLNDRGQVFGASVNDSGVGGRLQPFVFNSLGGGYALFDRPSAVGSVSGLSQDVFLLWDGAGSGRTEVYNIQTGQSAIANVPAAYGMNVGYRDDSGRFYGSVGDYGTGTYRIQSFVSENGEGKELAPPPGMDHARIEAVNARGDVLVQAGAGTDSQVTPEVFLQRDGVWTHLGTFHAVGLNDKGDVVGSDAAYVNPVMVPAGGSGPVVFGGLPGAWRVSPTVVNDRGEVAGTALVGTRYNHESHAFIDQNGVVTDLNSLIDRVGSQGELTIKSVTAINDLGQILALGTDGDSPVSFLLSPEDLNAAEGVFGTPYPVPEPSTLLVFAGLALGVGIARRGRRA